MSIFTAFANLFSGRNFSSISADQEKALIDMLTYAMAVDHEVAASEQEELTGALRNVDWEEDIALESFVHESVERARQKVASQQDAADYCRDISQRLAADWLREETYYLAGRIATADSEIGEEERQLLSAMVEGFALDDRVQARITDQLMRETDF